MDRRAPWAPARPDPYAISEMPSKEVLEDFLRGMSGPAAVLFDTARGVFVRTRDRAAGSASPPTVLAVSEHGANRLLLTEFLARELGVGVAAAASLGEALARARERRPALVLVDLPLSEDDGVAACRALKEDPATAGAPVVVLGGGRPRPEAAQTAACDDWLGKPFALADLVAVVRRHLLLALLAAPWEAAIPAAVC